MQGDERPADEAPTERNTAQARTDQTLVDTGPKEGDQSSASAGDSFPVLPAAASSSAPTTASAFDRGADLTSRKSDFEVGARLDDSEIVCSGGRNEEQVLPVGSLRARHYELTAGSSGIRSEETEATEETAASAAFAAMAAKVAEEVASATLQPIVSDIRNALSALRASAPQSSGRHHGVTQNLGRQPARRRLRKPASEASRASLFSQAGTHWGPNSDSEIEASVSEREFDSEASVSVHGRPRHQPEELFER